MRAGSEVGFCNTQQWATNGTPPTAIAAGIDTWRLVRYLDDDDELRAVVGFVGRQGVAAEKIEGHTVGVLPGHRMLWIEGHPEVDGLAAPRSLADAERRVLDGLQGVGYPIGTDAGVGRLDQTVTLRFEDPREGSAFLEGMAWVDVPRCKPAIYGRPVETVYLLGERSGRTLARIYDEGLKHRTAERGRLVRLENQTRYTKPTRVRAAKHAESPLAPIHFKQRFAPVAESAHGLHAVTLPVIRERVQAMVREGDLTNREAERMLGFLMLGAEGARYPRRTLYRRRREVRRHGLVMVDPLADPIDVDLGEALNEALRAWSDA